MSYTTNRENGFYMICNTGGRELGMWDLRIKEADVAVVFVERPCATATPRQIWIKAAGYLSITLQYRPYRAEAAREHSLAKGDFRENDRDSTYINKENTPYNASNLNTSSLPGTPWEISLSSCYCSRTIRPW